MLVRRAPGWNSTFKRRSRHYHYDDVIMSTIASQITSLTIVCSTVYSGADQSKHQSSASLAFDRGPVNSPHKWPVTRKMFPFDDVIMCKSGSMARDVVLNKIRWLLSIMSTRNFQESVPPKNYRFSIEEFPVKLGMTQERASSKQGAGGMQLPSFLFPTTFFGGANIVLREL